MSKIKKLAMVRDFWKHSDEGLRDEFLRMHEGFRFYTGDGLYSKMADLSI